MCVYTYNKNKIKRNKIYVEYFFTTPLSITISEGLLFTVSTQHNILDMYIIKLTKHYQIFCFLVVQGRQASLSISPGAVKLCATVAYPIALSGPLEQNVQITFYLICENPSAVSLAGNSTGAQRRDGEKIRSPGEAGPLDRAGPQGLV